MSKIASTTYVAAMILFVTMPATASAQQKPIQPPLKEPTRVEVPKNKAILDIDVPPGTKVTIDGEAPTKLKWTYDVAPGQRIETNVAAEFKDGSKAERKVILQGGWNVRVPLRPSASTRPEAMLQVGWAAKFAVLSADRKIMVTGDNQGPRILIWDAESGQLLRTIQDQDRQLVFLEISRDGKQILMESPDKDFTRRLSFYATHSGKLLRSFIISPGKVSLSPDGSQLLVCNSTRIQFWNANTGVKIRELNLFEQGGIFDRAYFTPDGLGFVTEGTEIRNEIHHGRITFWNNAGKEQSTLEFKDCQLSARGGALDRSSVLSSDGKRLLIGYREKDDSKACLADTTTGKVLFHFGPFKDLFCPAFAFHPDGKHFMIADRDDEAILYSIVSGKPVRKLKNKFESVEFLADGGRLLVDDRHSGIAIWDVAKNTASHSFRSEFDARQNIAFVPGRATLLLDRWTWAPNEPCAPKDTHSFEFHLTADGRKFVQFPNQEIRISEIESGKPISRAKLPALSLRAISANGEFVIGKKFNNDRVAEVFASGSGKNTQTLVGHTREVISLALSPDGQRAFTAENPPFSPTGDPKMPAAFLWKAATAEKTAILPISYVHQGVFSPDGRHLATASGDLTRAMAHLWDAATGKWVRSFKGHENYCVVSVAFGPDGDLLAAGDDSGSGIIWDTKSGQRLRTFAGQRGAASRMVFSPTGQHLLTRASHGWYFWDLGTGDLIAELFLSPENHDVHWLIVTPEGLFDGTEKGRQLVAWRVGGGLNVVPLDRFFQDFYRPGLFAAVMNGERPMPEVELARTRPPALRIVSPKSGGAVESNTVTLEVEATNQGGGIEGPWLVHNGARVLAKSKTEQAGKTVRREFTILLVEGENRLEARAATDDGSQESEPARMTFSFAKPLAKAELYVLAVGINDYAQTNLNLRFAANDAKAIVKVFEKRGAALYQKVHVRTLVDKDATKANIRDALASISKNAKPQDTLVLFLAGHGTMVGKMYYFLPHEFLRSEGKSVEDDIRKQGLPQATLEDGVEAIPALKRIVIYDTCQSGAAIGLHKTARSAFAFHESIAKLSRSQGVFVIGATAAGDEAQEIKELGHGILTYALLAGLKAVDKGPLLDKGIRPSNAEKVVEVLEWFSYASGNVSRLTRQYFGREQDVQTDGKGLSFPVLPIEDR